MTSITSNKTARILLPLIVWVGVWQCCSLALGSEFLLPSPLVVGQTLFALLGSGAFWQTAMLSLGRVLLGIVIGIALGLLLAILTWASPLADLLLSPIIRIIRAIPVASFILFVLLWAWRDLVPVIISALMVLPVVWGNVSQGLRETDPKLIELAHCLHFSRLKTMRLLYLPSALPYFLTATTTAMGLGWKAGVAAEVICLPTHSIGTEISYARLYLETPTLFAWTLVVVIFSMALERIISALLGRIHRRWQT